jgi:hypothetical protein
VAAEDIPAEVFEREKVIEMGREDLQSKPEAIRAKIAEGRVQKLGARRPAPCVLPARRGAALGDVLSECCPVRQRRQHSQRTPTTGPPPPPCCTPKPGS